VASGLGALRYNEVAACSNGPSSVFDLSAHVHHQNVRRVAKGDDVLWNTQTGDEDAGAFLDEQANLILEAAGHGGQQIHAEWSFGERPHLPDLADHARRSHSRRAEAPEPARFRDGRDKLGVGDSSHTREHHGVLYPKQLG